MTFVSYNITTPVLYRETPSHFEMTNDFTQKHFVLNAVAYF